MTLNRSLRQVGCDERPWLTVNGIRCIDFSSNDYLGFRFDERIKAAYIAGINRYGIGSGGSPLVCGYDGAKFQFEQAFSRYLGMEKSLLVSSGYAANLCVFSALFIKEKTDFFLDKSCHASIYDALKLREQAYTRVIRYPHQDANSLERLLMQSKAKNKVIVSEGIFSMTGQQTDIKALVALKHRSQAVLVIDDAHCIGVKGKKGRGSSASVKPGEIDLIICPLGKAFAMQCAVISAKGALINNLVQNARPYIYSTAPGSAQVQAFNKGLELISKAEKERAYLESIIQYFNQRKSEVAFSFVSSSSAIQFLLCGNSTIAVALYEQLIKMGLYCYPMREPTVPPNKAGLRIVLSTQHTKRHLDILFRELKAFKSCKSTLQR